jgi:hypothetical protein
MNDKTKLTINLFQGSISHKDGTERNSCRPNKIKTTLEEQWESKYRTSPILFKWSTLPSSGHLITGPLEKTNKFDRFSNGWLKFMYKMV